MDTDEQELQRQGFVEAFRSTAVHDAIRRGMIGRIGVVYMEWAGAADQRCSCRDGDRQPGERHGLRRRARREADPARVGPVSGAIDFSVRLHSDTASRDPPGHRVSATDRTTRAAS